VSERDLRLPSDFQRAVHNLVKRMAPGWHVSCTTTDGEYPVVVALTHPVSAGHCWIASSAQVEAGDLTMLAAMIAQSPELTVRPPATSNPRLLQGLRTVAIAFSWPGKQMSALAGVLEDSSVLTTEEGKWLRQVSGAANHHST